MASFDRTFSASPVLIMPPQTAHQSPFGIPSFSHQSSLFGGVPSFPLPQAYVSPSNSERRGRKRSRDEASENLDDRITAVQTEMKKQEEGWIYGPGMTLIKPGSGYVADASSQSGTWVEEKAAAEEAKRVDSATLAVKHQEQELPSLRSNKSQRLDLATPSSSHSNRSSPTRNAANCSTPVPSISLDAAGAPVVDDFTLAFGIGWRLINTDCSMSSAFRGWARYIENHYPISNANIYAECKSLQSYLIQASEGWYLFDENLRQGRLVSKDNQRCIENLKSSPPAFEGVETMTPSESPRAVSPHSQPIDMEMEMN